MPWVLTQLAGGQDGRLVPMVQWRLSQAQDLANRVVVSRAWPNAWVLLAMALAAALGLYHITGLSFWLDEASSVFAARLDWLRPWEAVSAGGESGQHALSLYMPLYFAILSAWLTLGESELAVRSLSVVFAVAAIPVVCALGARLYDLRAGAMAAFLLSVNGFFIDYARMARAYTMVILFAAAATLLVVRAVERGDRRGWVVYGAIAGVGMYAHLSLALVVATHLLVLPFVPGFRAHWKAALGGYAVLVTVATPLLLTIALQSVPGLDWLSAPTLRALPYVWGELAGHRSWQALFYAGCVAISGVLAAWLWHRDRVNAWRYILPVAGVIAPFAGLYAISQVRPMWEDRYLLGILPALVLLPAAIFHRLRPRWLPVAALAVVVLLSARSVVTHAGLEEGYKEEWREATAFVLARSSSDDGVVLFRPYVRMPFDYYVRLDNRSERAPHSIYPTSASGPHGRGPAEYLLDLRAALATTGQHDRVWLILSHDRDGERLTILDQLECRYELLERALFLNIEVRLYGRRERSCQPPEAAADSQGGPQGEGLSAPARRS